MLRFLGLALTLLTALAPVRAQAPAFGFDEVARLARDAAAVAWIEPADTRPAALRTLNYDQHRDIRYRPEKAVWRDAGLPFELQFFHLGRGLVHPVEVNEIHDGRVRRLGYDATAWDFGQNRFERSGDPAWAGLGHAGFRVHHALNPSTSGPAYKDELVVFLGASYFRALGRGQQYGLSARALAIDTVGGGPEEFPRFTRFWIERPAPDATVLTLLALLESPRATAALRFVITPGDTTTVDTRLRVFLRAGTTPPAMLGIAPLTSMFLHGENQPQAVDYRPEVHDSDGLQVAGVGPGGSAVEWLWRPLVNPPRQPYSPLAPSFALQRLHGFGLMQRDRAPRSYEDPEARYERRPSAWVEPVGDWGPGRVQLLMLPTPDETEDNIVAAWVPAVLPRAGEPLDIAYRLHWLSFDGVRGKTLPQSTPPLAHTVQSRRGRSWAEPQAGEVQHLVDFEGPALAALPAAARVDAVASTGPGGRVLKAHAYPLPPALGGGWRMQLRVQRDDPTRPLELRAFLRHGDAPLTETWAALLPPEPTR